MQQNVFEILSEIQNLLFSVKIRLFVATFLQLYISFTVFRNGMNSRNGNLLNCTATL